MTSHEQDKMTRWGAGRQFLVDAISNTRKPDGCVIMLIMMDKAREVIQGFREKQQPMTYTPLIARACALALRERPWMHSMIRGRKVVEPSNIEISISVAGKESVTPVVVIADPDRKSLVEIARELQEKARKAKEEEQQNIEKLNRYSWFIPAALRSLMAKCFMRSQRARRKLAGTFQISSIAGKGVEIGMPFALTTTAMLSLGHIARRPVVVEDKIEARLCSYFSVLVDHRIVDGKRAWEFLGHVKTLLEEPSELLS